MKELVLTPHFEKAYRKFVERDANLQERIENTLEQMEQDIDLYLASLTFGSFNWETLY
jgi:hypothetical protein